MTIEEGKPAEARTELERALGFRIEIRPDGEAGSVVWIGKTTVRPATGVEVKMWRMLQRLETSGVPADSVSDPFGTPKESDQA